MTTFGFEAEFQTNANAVITGLHAAGLAGDGRLHSYHCDCSHCEFGNGIPFRGQTDSSCSGEIISDVFGTPVGDDYDNDCRYVNETVLMAQLCDIAVEVDAEPGSNSGFHVHVGVQHLTTPQLADAIWQFVRWEHVLARVAGGRWDHQRSGMNRTVAEDCARVFHEYGNLTRVSPGGIAEFERDVRHDMESFKQALLFRHTENDRHSNLNVQQRGHPTWEFRLWNSTRSAWRMEMFCGLSVALVNPTTVAALAELAPPTRMSRASTGVADIALACSDSGYERLATLLERQATYLNDRAHEAPPVLTAL